MEWANEALSALQRAPHLGWALAGGLAALLFRTLLRWLFRPTRERKPERLEIDRASFRELQKTVSRLEGENTALSNLVLLLPDFTKEINSHMEQRQIAPNLMKIIDRLFSPSQILIFHAVRSDDGAECLTLVRQKGVDDSVSMGFKVAYGEGRIGWVAQHKMTMDHDDFIREMRLHGGAQEVPGHLRFKSELCAPMVHQDQVLGVISIGGVTRHYKYEKTMMTLLADLGSVAMYNNRLFSKTQQMANSDGLTGLYNKRFFMEKLANVILDAERDHHPFSLFIFDLDHFKHYNDTQGHQAGDDVLKATGKILQDTVRPDDIPARYGGEEFIVILAHSPKEGAMIAAERLRARVASHPFDNREDQPMKIISLSGGVSTFPDDGRTSAELIRAADEALYRAKKDGRNRVYRSEPKYLSDGEVETYYSGTNG